MSGNNDDDDDDDDKNENNNKLIIKKSKLKLVSNVIRQAFLFLYTILTVTRT